MTNVKMRHKKIKQLLQDAWSVRKESNYDEGRNLLQKAVNLCEDTDYENLGRIWAISAQYDRDSGDLEHALDSSRQSCAYYRSAANNLLVAHSVRHIGDILSALGKQDEARDHYEEALYIYRSDPETGKQDLANTLRPYGLLLLKIREIEKAKELLGEAKALYQAVGSQAGVEEMIAVIDSIK